ncbi:3'-5' exonuclease [Rothia uropygioeca]|uniref:3'-5' exonuclease n=1 Tax=Kocuria sp. 257 TaxID=2021970 RepID=UPI00192E1549|nr:3'-5' exonuclease [Kocuria sp. 257]
MTNQRNRDRKAKNSEAQADLVVSTIHGAKGMEFDNVVVLHKENPSMSQELKRMFYVAFTRAMNSMYVLSYGTVKNPPITSSYESIVNVLTERDKRAAVRAAGVDPDLLGDQPGSDPKDPSKSLSPA